MTKLKRTNTNEYKRNFYYNFNLMLENYGSYNTTIPKLLASFDVEVNTPYEKQRTPNLQQRLASFLSGLPDGFNLCYRYEILDFVAQTHDILKVPEDKEDICVNNIYSFCANMILKTLTDTDINHLNRK